MFVAKEGASVTVQDSRMLNRFHSNLQEMNKDRLPIDLESSFEALKQKFRQTHQRIYENFSGDRRPDLEDATHRSFVEQAEVKPEQAVKKHRRIMSAVPKSRNQTRALYTSEHNASTAFRDMKKMVQERNKDVVLAKYNFTHMLDIQGDDEKDKPPARLNKTGITFYSPYDHKVERTRKIENYKELIHKERIKNIARASQMMKEKIVKQQGFMKEKTQSISSRLFISKQTLKCEIDLFDKKKNATFIVEPNEPSVVVEADSTRSRVIKAKRKPALPTTVGSRNTSPQKTALASNESVRNLVKDTAKTAKHTLENLDGSHKNLHYFSRKTGSRKELSSISNLLKPHDDSTGQVKEEPEETSYLSVPVSKNNSRAKLLSNNTIGRKTPLKARASINISTFNSLSNVGKVKQNLSLNVTPAGLDKSCLSAAPTIVSPTEYEEQLKESKDLFTKKKNRVIRHLNRAVAKYDNSKQRLNNRLGDILTKLTTDRTELLVDKRKVVQKNQEYSKIDFLNGNRMRKEFETSLVQRKIQTEKQIQLYETCMRLLKELPPSFPPDKLEFLDKIKAKLEQGEYIGKDYFLKTIEKLDPDSVYWKQQEPLIIIFKNDNHINISDYEFDKWKERQRMHYMERKLLPLRIQYTSVSST